MKEAEYKRSELWYNRKTKEKEPIPEMTPAQLSIKIRITGRRIRDHKAKLDKIYDLRRSLIRTMVKKGNRIKTLEELQSHSSFIITGPAVTGSPGAVINYPTVVEHGIDIDDYLEKGYFIKFEEISEDDEDNL